VERFVDYFGFCLLFGRKRARGEVKSTESTNTTFILEFLCEIQKCLVLFCCVRFFAQTS
jgi:hypothetical protein